MPNKNNSPEQKAIWNRNKGRLGSRFSRRIWAPDWQAGYRFPEKQYDEKGYRIK